MNCSCFVFVWSKFGCIVLQITRSNLRFRIGNSGSLTVQNARSSDTGHYIGTATNVAGRGSVEFDVSSEIRLAKCNVSEKKEKKLNTFFLRF